MILNFLNGRLAHQQLPLIKSIRLWANVMIKLPQCDFFSDIFLPCYNLRLSYNFVVIQVHSTSVAVFEIYGYGTFAILLSRKIHCKYGDNDCKLTHWKQSILSSK